MAEDDGFGGGVFGVRGVEDGEQGVDFAAGGAGRGGGGGFAEVEGRVDEGGGGEGLGAAHGAAVLGFDDAGDAVEAELGGFGSQYCSFRLMY